MSITRREFMLATSGAAAGFILPSFYERVFNFVETTGEPLIEAPANAEIELIAYDWGGSVYELNLGDPDTQPPEITLRQYIDLYVEGYFGVSPEEYIEWNGLELADLDAIADFDTIIDAWCLTDSPNARAYRLLEEFDIGCSLGDGKVVGSIQFTVGASPGVDYLGVEVPDAVSISLLQKRLNELESGIRLVMG